MGNKLPEKIEIPEDIGQAAALSALKINEIIDYLEERDKNRLTDLPLEELEKPEFKNVVTLPPIEPKEWWEDEKYLVEIDSFKAGHKPVIEPKDSWIKEFDEKFEYKDGLASFYPREKLKSFISQLLEKERAKWSYDKADKVKRKFNGYAGGLTFSCGELLDFFRD